MAKSIVSILMKRDDYTEDEAKSLVNDVADTVEKLISSGGDISDCGMHPLVFTMFDIVDAPTMFPVTCRTGQAIVLEVEFEPSTLIFTSTNNFAGVKFQIIDPDLVSTPKTMKIEVIDGGSTGSDFYEGIIYSVEL